MHSYMFSFMEVTYQHSKKEKKKCIYFDDTILNATYYYFALDSRKEKRLENSVFIYIILYNHKNYKQYYYLYIS